jgi:hypothetical protein
MLGKKGQILESMIIIFAAMIILGKVNTVHAIRRIRANSRVERVTQRRAEYNGQIFNIYVNQTEKFISVHGKAYNHRDLRKIEKHFKLMAPAGYDIICDVQLGY